MHQLRKQMWQQFYFSNSWHKVDPILRRRECWPGHQKENYSPAYFERSDGFPASSWILAAQGKAGPRSQPCQEACNTGAAKFHTGYRLSCLLPHRALGIRDVTLSSSCLTAFYKHSLILAFKYFSSNNGKR